MVFQLELQIAVQVQRAIVQIIRATVQIIKAIVNQAMETEVKVKDKFSFMTLNLTHIY